MPVIPLSTDSPLRRTPLANYGLIAANVVVFALCFVFRTLPLQWELSPRNPHLYQFITYQFIHGGFLHIAGNMLFLYIFGNHINDKMGHVAYIAFYLAGGVFAGILYVLTEGAGHPIIGASGAIAAVTGAYLVLLPQSTVTIFYWFFFAGRMEVQSLYLIVFFFAQDIFLNLGQEDSVAHMAHIGGTVFGIVLCMALLAVHLLPRSQFDLWAFAQRWNRRRQYRDLVAKGYDPFNPAKGVRAMAGAAPAVPSEATELRQQVNAAIGMGQLPVAARLYSRLIAIDPTQVLSRQAQLDVATQLKHDGDFAGAAAAFDRLLANFPKSDHNGEIELLVGILYARDVHDPAKARTHLMRAIDKIHDEAKAAFARQALEELGPSPVEK
jgi:membrane associated rhomboid family serine protease